MARIRTIKPDFWEDEKVGRLADHDRLTFIGLISLADDEGRGRGDSTWLHGRLHPYSSTTHVQATEDSLRALADKCLVRLYSVNGESYYWIPNFKKHQRINRPTPSKLPPYPDNSTPPHGGLTEDSPMERERDTGYGKGILEMETGTGNLEGEGDTGRGEPSADNADWLSLNQKIKNRRAAAAAAKSQS